MNNTKYLYQQLNDWHDSLDITFEQYTKEELEDVISDMYYEDIVALCKSIVELSEAIEYYND